MIHKFINNLILKKMDYLNLLSFEILDLSELIEIKTELTKYDGCGGGNGQCHVGCGCGKDNGNCGASV